MQAPMIFARHGFYFHSGPWDGADWAMLGFFALAFLVFLFIGRK